MTSDPCWSYLTWRIETPPVLRKIRRREPKLPVIVWSASSSTEDILQAYAEGANMYAEKPSDLAQFRTTIHNIAQLWIAPINARAATAG